jgi:transposase-like protein
MEMEGIVFISNQNKSLQEAVYKVFPLAYHSHCCQHLADNIQKHFDLACQKLF